MALTALQVKQCKHSGGSLPDKLRDEKGLILLVHANGSKTWRLRYTFGNSRPELSLGAYPAISLAKARELADNARSKIAQGIDPREEKRALKERRNNVFGAIALEWWEKTLPKWTPEHAAKVKRWLENDVFPVVGKLPIEEIDQGHIRDIMLGIEDAGHPSSASPTLSALNRIFGYALAHRLTRNNPAQGFPLGDVLQPLPKTKHRAAITTRKELGKLLRAIDQSGTQSAYCTKKALQLLPHLFLRPKEIRQLLWEYVDFEAKLIRIPDSVMKKDREHLVPMSKQVVEQLEEIRLTTGYSPYVFPSERNTFKPMSKNVLTDELRRLGYNADTMTAHGFRATASTMLRELNWEHDVIEVQLAHLTGSATSRSYNHYDHLAGRKAMMQAWSDHLDALRDGADVVPIVKGKAA